MVMPAPARLLESDMTMYLARTLLTGAALAAGLLTAAQANAGGRDVAAANAPRHTAERNTFTDGAHSGQAGGMPPVMPGLTLGLLGRQGFSACAFRPFDPYQDGLRSGQTDPYANGGECLSALQPMGPGTAPGPGPAA